jgi:biopolymer transport protein ExbD
MFEADSENPSSIGSDAAPLAILALVLLLGAGWLFVGHLDFKLPSMPAVAPTAVAPAQPPTVTPTIAPPAPVQEPSPVAVKATAPPAKETIVVLRLGGAEKYWIDDRPATQRDVRSTLKAHFTASKDTAVMVQAPASLPSLELLKAMQIVRDCGIQRVAAIPLSDVPAKPKK